MLLSEQSTVSQAINGLFELAAPKAEHSTFNKIHDSASTHPQFNDRGGSHRGGGSSSSSMTVYVVCPRKSQLSPTGSHTDFEYQYK